MRGSAHEELDVVYVSADRARGVEAILDQASTPAAWPLDRQPCTANAGDVTAHGSASCAEMPVEPTVEPTAASVQERLLHPD